MVDERKALSCVVGILVLVGGNFQRRPFLAPPVCAELPPVACFSSQAFAPRPLHHLHVWCAGLHALIVRCGSNQMVESVGWFRAPARQAAVLGPPEWVFQSQD